MNIVQAEENLKSIITKFSKDTFVFDLLNAYNFPKATISKLKIKNKNLDDVVIPAKLHFVGVSKKDLDSKFDELVKDYSKAKKAPRFIIVTDYQNLKAYDTKVAEKLDTEIKNLPKHPDFFLPWLGIEKKVFQGENPADVKAAEKLAKLFDLILKDNLKLVEKNRHALNVFLTRILFCFFAEDTDIFKKGLFTESLASHTKADGGDLDNYLQRLFEVLNKKSRTGLPDFLKEFPYVNGGLFAEEFPIPKFSKKSRESLIDLGSDLNWAEINPDIFGSMIQAVVHPNQRAGLGMHYTSVTNIMKVIEPLFLMELKDEFAKAKGNKNKLKKLLERIGSIKVFDPACGSGNFLIIAYKELRLLEMDVLKSLGEIPMSGISLSNFYGIEIDDFAHEVAKLSLWLAEHQMNVLFNSQFGEVKVSLPLKDSGRVICGNATQLDWNKICPCKEGDEVYLAGNPPYAGYSVQTTPQKSDMAIVFDGIDEYKSLDYISCWFFKAKNFILKKKSECAFVSTNSIVQGEQVSLLWKNILVDGVEIGFAYQSFKWTNLAKAQAGVTCVIIGLRNISKKTKLLFTENSSKECKNISPYLTDSSVLFIEPRKNPLSEITPIGYGSSALDGGFLTLTPEEKKQIIDKNPSAKKFIFRMVGGQELIKGIERWIIWVEDTEYKEALTIPEFKKRFDLVKKFRSESKRGSTIEASKKPYRLGEPRFIKGSVLVIPKVSSERRKYLPISYFHSNVVIMDKAFPIYNPDPLLFGVLSSSMHIAWIKAVGGRLETRLSYSSSICYNTFPLPDLSEEQRDRIIKASFNILAAREKYSAQSLSYLYDPETMPSEIQMAHEDLDKEVDCCYLKNGFGSDGERLDFLFKLYAEKISKAKT